MPGLPQIQYVFCGGTLSGKILDIPETLQNNSHLKSTEILEELSLFEQENCYPDAHLSTVSAWASILQSFPRALGWSNNKHNFCLI